MISLFKPRLTQARPSTAVLFLLPPPPEILGLLEWAVQVED
jgi:hypothetical protein